MARSEPVDDRPATTSGAGVSWTPNGYALSPGVLLDGTGELTTSAPVLENGAAGFTVAAAVQASWVATGKLVIGRGLTAGVPGDHWVGGLDEVYAVPRQWSSAEINSHIYSDF